MRSYSCLVDILLGMEAKWALLLAVAFGVMFELTTPLNCYTCQRCPLPFSPTDENVIVADNCVQCEEVKHYTNHRLVSVDRVCYADKPNCPSVHIMASGYGAVNKCCSDRDLCNGTEARSRVSEYYFLFIFSVILCFVNYIFF